MPRRLVRFAPLALALAIVAAAGSAAPLAAQPQRPAAPAFQGNITFLYYRDIPRAQRFYEEVLGLTLTVDQGFSKIYQVSPTSFVGLVDESQGLHRASETKAVTLSFVVQDIDGWYAYLKARGVPMRGEVKDATRHPTRGFVAYDPEGYFLEFERFLDHPQNTALNAALQGAEQALRGVRRP